MRSCPLLLVSLLAAGATSMAVAQSASAPGGWPRSMPLPPAGAPGTTRTVIQQAPTPGLDAEQVARRFQVAGDQVYDRKTDLTWQRCDFGQSWDESSGWCRGVKRHATADALGEAARSDAPGWRVPTIDELASMMEVACRGQAKDVPPVFAEIEHGAGMTYYLSSSPSGTPDGIMAQQCMGSMAMSAGLGRRYTSITHLVHSGPMAGR
jgi:hypothetical protein